MPMLAKQKISEEQKEDVKQGLTELRESMKSNDIDTINKALDNVNMSMQKITQELYSNANQTENTDGFSGSDVEFEEVK